MKPMSSLKARAEGLDEYSFEARLYDKVWGRYDYDADVKFLNRVFKKHGSRTVIDIGCGTDNHATRLAKLGYEVTAMDISPAMLRIARNKAKSTGIRIRQGDLKNLAGIFPKDRFDAAFMLGHVAYHLNTDRDVRTFLKGVRKILKQNGLLVFNARNSTKIDEALLNKLRLAHTETDRETQIVILEHNLRDPDDRDTIVWRPIFLIKENGRIDFQTREHKLRWFKFKQLKRLLTESGFRLAAAYSGPSGETFNEGLHADMWLVATTP